MTVTDQDIWVCTDCYFAHHFGYRGPFPDPASEYPVNPDDYDEGSYFEPMWLVGPDFEYPKDVTAAEPLNRCDGLELSDNTCSNHYYHQTPGITEDGLPNEPCDQCGRTEIHDGVIPFSRSPCEGCGSHLASFRYRLHYEMKETP